jgi:hypothetical protein
MPKWFIAALLATSPVLMVAKSGRDWLTIVGQPATRRSIRRISPSLQMIGDNYCKTVFDAFVRAKTDRFVLKFTKPKKLAQ